MEKYILKLKSVQNGGDIALKANLGLKISSKTNDDAIVQIKKSLSVRGDKLAKILNSKTFQPLFIDFNGTSSSIGTSSNICDDENVQPQSNNEGTLNRYLNGMENLTPPSVASHISAMNVNPRTPQNHHVLARLQRDLDSPSAATRLRAMRALKSPANGPYNQFDIPHEEQDIITEEERQDVVPVTIQDVMKDVTVYVEVRFGDENRTASIKGTMAELGATVNDNFNKNTTHLIFSNGTQSTYNKAKQLNIPIVSLLWIEECKKQLRLVDPSKYTIHNAEQYENPELYKKVKVKKFFKTENELKFKKPKRLTPSTLPKLKSIRIPKKAQDNLTGMLKEFQQRQANNSNGIDYFSANFNVRDLFNDSKTNGSMRKESSTRRALFNDSQETNADGAQMSPTLHLNATQNSRGKAKSVSPNNKPLEQPNVSIISTKPPQVPKNNSPAVFKTPVNRKTEQSSNSLVRVTRRSSLALPSPSADRTPFQRNRHVMPEEITEINDCNVNQTKNVSESMEITPSAASPPRVISSRRTIFTSSGMDVTDPRSTVSSTRKRNSIIPARFKDFEVNTSKYLVKNSTNNISQSEKSNRRRTVFGSSEVASSSLAVSPLKKVDEGLKELPNRRRTLFALNQTASNTVDVSTPKTVPEAQEPTSSRRETVFAPMEASSPIVVNKAGTRDVSNLHRSLFKPNNTASVTETINEIKDKTSSKRRRTLLPPNNVTSSPSVVSTLKKIEDIQMSAANRRRTALPLNNTEPSSLVVSTLDKVGERQDTSTNRRRTVFTSSHADSRGSATPTMSKANGTPKAANRRRTCFTSRTEDNPSQDKLVNGLDFKPSTDVQTPPTVVAERNKSLSGDYLTPQSHTLLEEYSRTITFSSTNKRQTDRDISLYIVGQRLKNINELARLNRSDVNIDNIEKSISEKLARSSPQVLALENGGIKKTATVNEDEPPAPKKRRLFDPTAYEEQVVMKSTDSSDNNNKTSAVPSNGSVTQKKKMKSAIPLDKRFKQRRSTMDFQTEAPKPAQVYANIMKTTSPMKFVAFTNMNPEQVSVINEAVTTLGNFKVESNVTKRTTHLVTCDSKRTQKLLRAIIRGLWIVDYNWVTASLQAGFWLHEEPFENRSFSNAVSMCRAEAQAFGSKYKIEIFGHLDPIYISTKCKCPDLTELYTMCGGRVTNNRTSAKYVVTDKFKKDINQICVRSDWILDSITAANCKNPSNYILKLMPL